MNPDTVVSNHNNDKNNNDCSSTLPRAPSSPTGTSSSEEERTSSSNKEVVTNLQPDHIASTTAIGVTEQKQQHDESSVTGPSNDSLMQLQTKNNNSSESRKSNDNSSSSEDEENHQNKNSPQHQQLDEQQQQQQHHDEDNLDGSSLNSHDPVGIASPPLLPRTLAEPDYTKANKIKFAMLCDKFETLWKKRAARTNRLSKDERLEFILPQQLFKYLKGGSPYPLLRLIIPKSDSSRPTTGVKEAGIARAWGSALGLHKESRPYLKLVKFTDPTLAGPKAAGDLSVAIQEVLEERIHKQPSKVTIGEINDLLDELQSIKHINMNKSAIARNHAWRNTQSDTSNEASAHQRKKKKGPTKDQLRTQWVEKLIRKKLSPLEHKWIVRIVLQQVEIGLGDSTILKYYSKYALDLWNANNSLKRLCTTLSDPEWLRQRKEQEELEKMNMDEDRRRNHMPRSTAIPALGDVLSPMLAKRTFFREALTDITKRHRQFAKNQSEDAIGVASLALKFPTFICEIKLDGERIVTHMERGIVKMQTRNSNWYSQNYSPVLGPALRKAISKFDVDVILDGEVVAWDDGRKETIPFGANRTVASMRRAWCYRHGLIDERDTKLHINEDDANVVGALPDFVQNKNPFLSDTEGGNEPGSECWLKYIIFDILFVGGPGASALVSSSISPNETPMIGSIINLPAFERKKILYRLIEPQENQVEIVSSLIVRSNGTSCTAAEYFSPSRPSSEFGYTCSSLDSIECVLRRDIPNLEEIERKIRSNRSDNEINQSRAAAVDSFYSDIVEDKCMEGLVFKDLVSPYVLGDFSREVGYWFKLKADYHENPHHASDIDVIVLGADYATGMSKSGLLNSFLVGCADSDNPGKYMTLCKVNGGGASRKELQKLLDHTEYNREAVQDGSFGKWFTETDHRKSLPDFISCKSFQRVRKGDNDGWKFSKDKYPDLWINPDDSVVLTLNAGEITSSDGFSAGVTLRFPRITHVRLGEATKPPQDVESVEALHELYVNRVNQASEASGAPQGVTGSKRKGVGECRFFTEEQLIQYKKRKPTSRTASVRKETDWRMPCVPKRISTALDGLTFTVLEGTYALAKDSLDAEEAQGQGWYKAAKTVHCREDVMEFVMKHGGTCKLTGTIDTDFILGGRKDDARVTNFHRALNAASKDRKLGGRKSDIPVQKIIQLGGVLKWTFVFALVNRWEKGQANTTTTNDGRTRNSVNDRMDPDSIQPGRHDFLVLSNDAEAALTQREDMFGLHFSSISKVDLKRTLDELSRQKGQQNAKGDKLEKVVASPSFQKNGECEKAVPWQFAAMHALKEDERWIMGGGIQCLWPYKSTTRSHENIQNHAVVIFPCLFRNDMGFIDTKDAEREICASAVSTRWGEIEPEFEYSSILATLPLARAMGAQVTPHLHNGVTHVLCDLQNNEHLVWRDSLYPDFFTLREVHARLKEIRDLEKSRGNKVNKIMIVTPEWLTSKWPSIK